MARKKTKKRSKPRPSILGILGMIVTPIFTFLIGNYPGNRGGFLTTVGSTGNRLRQGFDALAISYIGYSFLRGTWEVMGLIQGYGFLAMKFVVNKLNFNRTVVPRGSMLVL